MPDKQHLQSIHALDSIVEELTFVATPLLGTAAMALADSRWVTGVGAFLLLPAALGLTSVLRTLPTHEDAAKASDQAKAAVRRRSPIRSRDGQGITVPVIVLGLCGGGLNVIIPAATEDYANVISALSSSALTIVAVFCVGLPMTPIFVIAYLLVDERIDTPRHAEANAWLGSGYNLGSGAGSMLGGQLLALTGPRLVAITLAAIAGLATLIAHRLPNKPSPGMGSEAADIPPEAGKLSSEAP